MRKALAAWASHNDRLRTAFVLVRVDLTPFSAALRGNWKQTWQQSLEILQRCVYLDKDLVLPPMGTSSAAETFFVVASTDMPQVGIMTARIREQLERMPDFKIKCSLSIIAAPIELPPPVLSQSLDQQIQTVADHVTAMVTTGMQRKHPVSQKLTQNSN